jgi:hypothetical protein
MSKLIYLFDFILDHFYELLIKKFIDRDSTFDHRNCIYTILMEIEKYDHICVEKLKDSDIIYSIDFMKKVVDIRTSKINIKFFINFAFLFALYKLKCLKNNNYHKIEEVNKYCNLNIYISENDLEFLSSHISDETVEFIETYLTLSFVF